VDISFTVCFFRCMRVRLFGYGFLRRGYSERRQILHGGLSVSMAGNLTFLGTLLPKKPKIGRIRVTRALADSDRDATFVEYRAACGT